ncbi:hypothetical protein BV25DRAFT_186567 [Artomyces pyxidatus]|uniref:Uncharacterized protein n=1 Tax=Artomyces pyxidatus TaxID=48021 RepID=A0ACB8T995_9AGAM|nr:hypothetical protein BV25DRAFT_186567 [Artomyces pyxidatus]
MQTANAAWDGDMSMVRKLAVDLQDSECAVISTDGTVSSLGESQSSDFRRKLLCVLANTPAPNLESLAFGPFSPQPGDYVYSVLFADIVPQKLKHVALHRIDLPSHLCIFRAPLTSLDLRASDVWETMEDMLETLRCLPNLQSLILEESDPKDRWKEPPQPSHSVALPFLRKLVLISGAELTMEFLNRLSIPDDVWLTVGIALGPDPVVEETHEWDYLSDMLHAHIPDELYDALRFQALSIMPYLMLGCPSGFIFQSSSPWLVQDGPGSSRPLPSLGLKVFWYDVAPGDYLPDIIDSFIDGIDSLAALTVGCPEFTAKVWQSLAGHFYTVERITVSSRAAALGLLSALASDSPEPLFPDLRTICFEQMTLGDGRSKMDKEIFEETVLPVGWSILDRLMRVIDNRDSIELGIRLVVITQCDVEAPMIEALQRHLGYHTVDWDGATNGFYTYFESTEEERQFTGKVCCMYT